MVPYDLDLASTTFCDETIITYEIELPTTVKKIGYNLLDDDEFTISYIFDTIPNSPAGNQLPTQVGNNPSQKKGHLVNYRAIKLNVENPRPRSVYSKVKSTNA